MEQKKEKIKKTKNKRDLSIEKDGSGRTSNENNYELQYGMFNHVSIMIH